MQQFGGDSAGSAGGGDSLVCQGRVYYLHPTLALYTGLFFGPWVTFVTALITVRGRIGFRNLTLLFGATGAGWCLVQGATVLTEPIWEMVVVQWMRTSINFCVGALCFFWLWKRPMRSGRGTTVRTVIFLGLATLAWFMVEGEIWVRLGR